MPEKQDVDTDDDCHHREYVEHESCLFPHYSVVLRVKRCRKRLTSEPVAPALRAALSTKTSETWAQRLRRLTGTGQIVDQHQHSDRPPVTLSEPGTAAV